VLCTGHINVKLSNCTVINFAVVVVAAG